MAATAHAQTDTVLTTFGSGGVRFRAEGIDIRLGAVAQGDARFFASEGDIGTDGFLLRRARITLQGLIGPVGFRVIPDFGQGRVEVEEAWAEVHAGRAVAIRAGHQKVPVGMEWLRSSSDLAFVERALPSALVPRSDPGVSLRAEPADGIEMAFGVYNGVPDGTNGGIDAGDGKDLAVRVFAQPFSGSLSGLGVGVGASYGEEAGSSGASALASYRTATGRTIAAFRGGDSTVVAAGARTRVAPQASLTVGPASAYGEWVISTHEVERVGLAETLSANAWQVAATVVLTGEDATLGRLRPARPLGGGGMGAFEVALRYHALTLEEDAFPFFIDPDAGARTARSITAGLNWYLTPFARISLNAEHTSFGAMEGFEDPPAEVVFLGRMQVSV
jgi:phosphate-selective porin OprO/OprP